MEPTLLARLGATAPSEVTVAWQAPADQGPGHWTATIAGTTSTIEVNEARDLVVDGAATAGDARKKLGVPG